MSINLSAVIVPLTSVALTHLHQPTHARPTIRSSSRPSQARRELARLMSWAQTIGAEDYLAELWDIAGRSAAEQSRRLPIVRRDMAETSGLVA